MSNAGRSTTGGPAVPYQPRSPRIEATNHLRLMAQRYGQDRATLAEVEDAITLFHNATMPDMSAHVAAVGPLPVAVLEECLNALLVRVRWYEARNKTTPDTTLSALQHRCRKLGKNPTEL